MLNSTALTRRSLSARIRLSPLISPPSSPLRRSLLRSFSATSFRNEDGIASQFQHLQTQPTKSADGTSASELARRLSQNALPKLERPVIKKVCMVGSGATQIGQSGEFDFSGESRGRLQ
jgi:carbamoyl-phosphate synthase large subunit